MTQQRYLVPIPELEKSINVLSGEMWPCGNIAAEEVLQAVKLGKLEKEPWSVFESRSPESRGPNCIAWDAERKETHIKRIAYFVHNGIPTDDDDPIRMGADSINLGIGLPQGNRISLEGNITLHIAGRHRLAAAVIRGDREIEIIFDRNQDIVRSRIPNAIPLADKTARASPAADQPVIRTLLTPHPHDM